MLAAAEHLADHIHEAPVWIVPCLAGPRQPGSGASVFPAVQNMLLAARALGLGATLTTLYLNHEKAAEAAMGIPDTHHSYAILPVGYPLGRLDRCDARRSPTLCMMTSGDSTGLRPDPAHSQSGQRAALRRNGCCDRT